MLAIEPSLQAKTIFEQVHPGRFRDGQVRTLRRRISYWRAREGPAREVYFAQEHRPGALCQSDFTHCRELGVTINGQAFPHLCKRRSKNEPVSGARARLLGGGKRYHLEGATTKCGLTKGCIEWNCTRQ